MIQAEQQVAHQFYRRVCTVANYLRSSDDPIMTNEFEGISILFIKEVIKVNKGMGGSYKGVVVDSNGKSTASITDTTLYNMYQKISEEEYNLLKNKIY